MGIVEFVQEFLSDIRALIGSALVVVGLVLGILIIVKGHGRISSVVMGIISGGLIAALGVIVISAASMFKHEINQRALGQETSQVRVVEAAGPVMDSSSSMQTVER